MGQEYPEEGAVECENEKERRNVRGSENRWQAIQSSIW